MVKVVVVMFSLYGHMATLAESFAEGARQVAGVETEIWQVPELLSPEVLAKMHATESKKALEAKYQTLDHSKLVEVLSGADAIVFAMGTRFGHVPAQVTMLMDSCGQLWATGALIGKVCAALTGSATQHGGQEMTVVPVWAFAMHMGMLFAGVPPSTKSVSNVAEITGGGFYASAYVAGGDGSRAVSDNEKEMARAQGQHVARSARAQTLLRAAEAQETATKKEEEKKVEEKKVEEKKVEEKSAEVEEKKESEGHGDSDKKSKKKSSSSGKHSTRKSGKKE